MIEIRAETVEDATWKALELLCGGSTVLVDRRGDPATVTLTERAVLTVERPTEIAACIPEIGVEPAMLLAYAINVGMTVNGCYDHGQPCVIPRAQAPKGALVIGVEPQSVVCATAHHVYEEAAPLAAVALDLAAACVGVQVVAKALGREPGPVSLVTANLQLPEPVVRKMRDQEMPRCCWPATHPQPPVTDGAGIDQWLREARMFLTEPAAIGYKTPFFRKTAPHVMRACQLAGEGSHSMAAETADECAVHAWRIATLRFLQHVSR